ncbi:hypothetical protein [Methylobacterium soli]|uniref:Uncharacterized protein n=1 Tax=Methylobacterium soli TaxID=553447 RepID=A0A6L3SS41_9HYPH|nr:hypothetical protein [Methylobacterium soli]KAB1069550.1 hypothetical protein F6X53_30900 [Methylobacterium soli]GJE42440.1 hypothetical protein AEGHOMDF_1612 [Methylobacterium soli]
MAQFAGYIPTILEPLADREKRWTQDGADAWVNHDEALLAQDEKTARLKALRLAKEAAETEVAAQAALISKPKRKINRI